MNDVILKIEDIDISFGGIHAVNHLSFNVNRGEILGLIGPNGSGKSTLVNIISGLYTQDSGKVIMEGDEIQHKSVSDRIFLGIGRTFQSPKPFLNLTVFESLYITALVHNRNKQVARDEAQRALEFMGLDQVSNIRCSKLPVEMRKWLDMARLLPAKPKVLLLDECLAGLNPSEMNDSLEVVKRINASGITIVFIEHVMAAVTKICDRVVVLNEGSLLCEGIPSDVMRQDEVVKAYLGKEYLDAQA
jgi:branched-chain amino acid transport system ATP-binding protein